MTFLSLMLLALGLSVDAFAAALGRGAALGRPRFTVAVRTGFVFGASEMTMPAIGWALGTAFAGWVEAIDHWIAFCLLAAVGIHTALAAFRPAEDDQPKSGSLLVLIGMAIGTSVDAMAVGVSLALLDVDIRIAAPTIGLTCFTVATTGMLVGRMVGSRVGPWAEAVAGIGLVLLGCGILWEHTMG